MTRNLIATCVDVKNEQIIIIVIIIIIIIIIVIISTPFALA